MESFWPEVFSEQDISTPNEILERQLKFLPKLTKDMVYGEVVENTQLGTHFVNYDFVFKLNLKGTFLDNYKFTIFTFGHNISFYPVKVQLDRDISDECKFPNNVLELKNEGEFSAFLKNVFNSEKIRIVITSIMKIS